MKRKIMALAAALLSSAGMNAQNVKLNLNVKGLADGTKMTIELAGTYDQYQNPVQVVELKGGHAQFAFNVDGPRGYSVHPTDGYGYQTVVLSPGENATFTAVYTRTQGFDEKPNYQVTGVQVTGSDTHDFYSSHKPRRDSLDALYEKYHVENKDVLAKIEKLSRGSAERKKIEETPEYKKFAADEHHFFQTADSVLMAPVHKYHDSWWGPFFLCTGLNYLTEEQKPLYEQFTDAAKNSFYGKVVQQFACPPSIKGTQMPDFTFTDHQTGKKTSLYEICKKSKYVLIDFWASWCGPCRREIPNFKSQYDLYHKKGFDIVSISADSKEADWIKALNEEKLQWPNDIDGQQGICAKYKVSAYPTVYILDSEGKAVAKDMEARGENLRKLLAELFK